MVKVERFSDMGKGHIHNPVRGSGDGERRSEIRNGNKNTLKLFGGSTHTPSF